MEYVIGFLIGFVFCFIFCRNSKSEDYSLYIENAELTEENEDLEELRQQEQHNNTVLLEKNKEVTQLLTEVADMSVVYMIGHEKETLGKIRELTRPYQSDVNSQKN